MNIRLLRPSSSNDGGIPEIMCRGIFMFVWFCGPSTKHCLTNARPPLFAATSSADYSWKAALGCQLPETLLEGPNTQYLGFFWLEKTILRCSGDLVSGLSNGPYGAAYGLLWGPVGDTSGLTESTDHPSTLEGIWDQSAQILGTWTL